MMNTQNRRLNAQRNHLKFEKCSLKLTFVMFAELIEEFGLNFELKSNPTSRNCFLKLLTF